MISRGFLIFLRVFCKVARVRDFDGSFVNVSRDFQRFSKKKNLKISGTEKWIMGSFLCPFSKTVRRFFSVFGPGRSSAQIPRPCPTSDPLRAAPQHWPGGGDFRKEANGALFV